jgi:hypothetical protein
MVDGFRTNVGIVTGDAVATMEFNLHDSDGSLLADRALELPPRSLRQFSMAKLFSQVVTPPNPAGSLIITGNTAFLAYLTVIDGSSQDPVFVMSR